MRSTPSERVACFLRKGSAGRWRRVKDAAPYNEAEGPILFIAEKAIHF